MESLARHAYQGSEIHVLSIWRHTPSLFPVYNYSERLVISRRSRQIAWLPVRLCSPLAPISPCSCSGYFVCSMGSGSSFRRSGQLLISCLLILDFRCLLSFTWCIGSGVVVILGLFLPTWLICIVDWRSWRLKVSWKCPRRQ